MISNVRLAVIILIIWTALMPTRGCAALSQVCAENVGPIAALNGASQRKALRSLLSGNFLEEHESLGCLFYYGDRLRQPLRALLRDPKFGELALHLLGLVGEPNVPPLLLVRPPSRPANRWAYDVVCTMLEPASEEEWSFLRKAAFNGFHDCWVDYGAIQTLKLIASPRSRQILDEARRRNPDRAKVVAAALDYMRSNPSPLSDTNLVRLAKRTAEAVKIGKLEGVETPQYNQEHDKALVDFLFVTGSDELIYTATFHDVAGIWKLRGVRETVQMMLPPRVPPPSPPPSLMPPPPPDLPYDPPTIPPLFPLLQPKASTGGPSLLHLRC
jgi:hypothetical protein